MKYLDDALLAGGCCCVVAGVAMWSVPAALITGGVLMIGLAVVIGKINASGKAGGK